MSKLIPTLLGVLTTPPGLEVFPHDHIRLSHTPPIVHTDTLPVTVSCVSNHTRYHRMILAGIRFPSLSYYPHAIVMITPSYSHNDHVISAKIKTKVYTFGK